MPALYIFRPAEKAGRGTDWPARSSSQTRLAECKENTKCSRTLERASCRCSTELHESRIARAHTRVPGALPGCEGSQNQKLNGTARSYKRRSAAPELQECLQTG